MIMDRTDRTMWARRNLKRNLEFEVETDQKAPDLQGHMSGFRRQTQI
jgi:hypothetical protein